MHGIPLKIDLFLYYLDQLLKMGILIRSKNNTVRLLYPLFFQKLIINKTALYVVFDKHGMSAETSTSASCV